MASKHEYSAIGERRGSGSGLPRSTGRRERVLAVALGAALASGSLSSFAPHLAHAQAARTSPSPATSRASTDPIERADVAFEEGRTLFEVGRYKEACEKFELSMQLDPSPGTLLNLGNCYELQGDLVRALENFERAFSDAQRTNDTRRKELWTEAARARIASLSPRVPQLSIRNVPPDGRVSLDQHPLERSSGALRINPGRHLVEVSAPGKRSFQKDIEVGTGQRFAIDVPALEPDQDLPDAAEPAPANANEARREDPRHASNYGPWPYVLGGAGLGLLATSLGTGLAAKSKQSKLENECAGTACAPELAGTRDSAKTLALFTDIFWVTGLISVGAGVTLLVLDSQDDAPSTSVEAGCFGGGCGLVANGRF